MAVVDALYTLAHILSRILLGRDILHALWIRFTFEVLQETQ